MKLWSVCTPEAVDRNCRAGRGSGGGGAPAAPAALEEDAAAAPPPGCAGRTCHEALLARPGHAKPSQAMAS
eukprot:9835939-Alexandrium_andersonii.AAC.1